MPSGANLRRFDMRQMAGIWNQPEFRSANSFVVSLSMRSGYKAIALTPDDQGRRRYSIKISQ